MVEVVAHWVNAPGQLLASGSSITVGVRMSDVTGLGVPGTTPVVVDPLSRVDYTFTDSLGGVVTQSISSLSLQRFAESSGFTDPITGCGAGEQVPVECFACTQAMAALAPGAFTVDAQAWPTIGGPRTLPTQRHWNNRDSALTRQTIYLNGSTGNDANDGLGAGTPKLTMRGAMSAGLALTGNNLGLVDVVVNGTSLWNDSSAAGDPGITANCGPVLYCRILIQSGATLGKDGDWINRPHFNPGAGNRVAFWFQGPGKILGKLRTTVDSGSCDVVFDHTIHTPHAPWDGGSDPWCGAYDEGRHGLFWVSTGEPANTHALGCDISGMEQPFSDKNTLLRGCKLHKAFGVMLQLAGGTGADSIESNTCVVSCHVEDWRHSTGNVGIGVSAPLGYVSATTNTVESQDNGSGKLRIIETSGGAEFQTESANLVGSTLIGLKVTIDDAAGDLPFTVAANVLAAGTSSGHQYVDLDLDFASYSITVGANVTMVTARVNDASEWSNVIHSDVVKCNRDMMPRQFAWWDVSSKNITAPRFFGLDSHIQDVAIGASFSATCGIVQNNDFGALGQVYNNVLIQNVSFAGSVTFFSQNGFFAVEIRDCIFGGTVSGGTGGTLSELASKADFVNCHFVDSSMAVGLNPTTGTAFSSGTPGQSGDARLTALCPAIGSASGAADRPAEWFLGDRGALLPQLQGDFSIPGAPVIDYDDLAPAVFQWSAANLGAASNQTHMGAVTMVRPIWPAGALDSGNASAASSSTLTDAAKAWTANQWRGYWVKVLATGLIFNLKGNTSTRLDLVDGNGGHSTTETFDAASLAALQAGGGYQLGPVGPALGLQQVDDPWTADNPVTDGQDVVPKTFMYPTITPGSAEPAIDEVDWVPFLDVDAQLNVKVSKRAAQITRLGVRLRGIDAAGHPYDYDEQDILLRAARNGLGSSFGQNASYDEFYSGVDDGTWARTNPTHGGAETRPHFSNDYDTPLNRLITSWPMPGGTFIQSGQAGTASGARLVSTCVPLEFISDGVVAGSAQVRYQRLGGDNNTYILYPRHRQTEAMMPFVGGRRFLHRLNHWFYDPDAYDETRYGAIGKFLMSFAGFVDLLPIFDEAWFVDPITGTTTQIDAAAFQVNDGDQWQAFARVTDLEARYLPFGGGETDIGFPYSGNYGAVIFRRSSDDFTCGAILKLGDVNGTGVGREALSSSIVIGGRRQTLNPTVLARYDDAAYDSWIAWNAGRYYAPQPGWHCVPVYMYFGPFANAVSTISEAYTSGLLDTPSDVAAFADVPDVLTGTDLGNLFGFDDLSPATFQLLATQLLETGGLLFSVEDGTGIADANSYASVTAADDYFEALGNPAAWSAASQATKEAALRVATREMDLRYALVWTSSPKFPETQALAHPQGTTYDVLNRPHTSPPLPDALVQSCCEAALREVQVPGSLRPTQPSIATSAGQTIHAGPFSFQTNSGATVSAQDVWSKIDQIMRTAGLIDSGNWARR